MTSLGMSGAQYSTGDMVTSHEKISHQIRANQESYRKFQDYLRNLKRTNKQGDPVQLRIEGVPSSDPRLQGPNSQYFAEQLPPGIIQYVGLDGSVYYQQAPEGTLAVGGQQYAFGYPSAEGDQEYLDADDGQAQAGPDYQMIALQNEESALNKQHLNQSSQGLLQTEQFQQHYPPSQMFQIEGAGYHGGDVVQVAMGGPELNQLNADLSIEGTEPNRGHPTSADQLDTGSGSDGPAARFHGLSQGFPSGAPLGPAAAHQKHPVYFEFTSQRTLQAGSKETIGNDSDPNHRLSQQHLQAQLPRNHKRASERGDVGRDQGQAVLGTKGGRKEGPGGKQHLSGGVAEHQGRKTIEF